MKKPPIVQLPIPTEAQARIVEVKARVVDEFQRHVPLTDSFKHTREFVDFAEAHAAYLFGDEYFDARIALLGGNS